MPSPTSSPLLDPFTVDQIEQAVRDFNAMMEEPVVLPGGFELRALPPEDVYRERLRAHFEERFAGRALKK